jgi:hypothetical protein
LHLFDPSQSIVALRLKDDEPRGQESIKKPGVEPLALLFLIKLDKTGRWPLQKTTLSPGWTVWIGT